jgi:hypothetical protein
MIKLKEKKEKRKKGITTAPITSGGKISCCGGVFLGGKLEPFGVHLTIRLIFLMLSVRSYYFLLLGNYR